MKRKILFFFVISLFVILGQGFAYFNPGIEISNNRISIKAEKISAKILIKEIEKKTSLKIMIYEGLKDKNVSIDMQNIPISNTAMILKKIGYNNIATLFNKKNNKISFCILPQGKNINSIILNNPDLKQIKQVNFNADAHKVNSENMVIKGKKISSFNNDKISVKYVKDEIILRFTKGLKIDEINNELKKYSIKKIASPALEKIGYIKGKLTDSESIEDIIPELRKNPYLAVSEPDYILSSMLSPQTTASSKWYISETNFHKANTFMKHLKKVKIAILDTGIDANHPDLKNCVSKGYNIFDNNLNTSDDNGHGSFVAGIIASSLNQTRDNSHENISQLIPVKIIGSNGMGTYEDTARGIIWAADSGVDVINLSVGGYSYSNLLNDAIKYALSKGCVIVAAGGNEGTSIKMYPAAFSDVIAVSALALDGKIWQHSNRGEYIDVCAPGENIVSTGNSGSYVSSSGTSASAAMVSALAAMLISNKPDLPSTFIPQLIFQTSKDLGKSGRDNIYGFGCIDALNGIKNKIKAFHDVGIRALKMETNIINKNNSACIYSEIINMGTYDSEKCSIELFKYEKGKYKQLLDKREIELISLEQMYFTWKPQRISKDIQFEIVVSGLDDINKENNKMKTRFYDLNEENDMIAVKHKSEPNEQVHQFIAGEGWELIRRYMPGYEKQARVLNFNGIEVVKDNKIMVSEINMPLTQTQTYSPENHNRVFYQSKKMAAEFDEHIGRRILFKVGNSMKYDLLDDNDQILNNINSGEIDDFQDYNNEMGTFSITYTGKLDKDISQFARSLPFSIYYSTFQFEGDRDSQYEEFIEEQFGISLPWSWYSTGEIYSSEDAFIGLENNPGGIWGKLTDPQFTNISLGNDDIIEGAHEEDVFDIITNHAHFMGILNSDNFFHHFWDTDTYNNGKFNDGYSSDDASEDNSAYTVSEVLFKYAVDSYIAGDKDKGYYILGRVVHLLEDMGAVPHVHNDPHPFYDAYEAVMSKVYDGEFHEIGDFKNGKSVYLNWHVDTPKRELKSDVEQMSADKLDDINEHFTDFKPLMIPSFEELKNNTNPVTSKPYAEYKKLMEKEGVENIEQSWKSRSDLFRLFYSMAEIADDFPSDDYDGDIISQSDDVDKDLIAYKYYAPVVQPAIIEHLAGLYNLFWSETHGFVTGFVKDFSGEPVENAEVILHGDTSYTTTSDENGAFYFYDLESPGEFYLIVSKTGYNYYDGSQDPFNVVIGQTSEINIRLWDEAGIYSEEQMMEAVKATEFAKDKIIIEKENIISQLSQNLSNNNELITDLNNQINELNEKVGQMVSLEKVDNLIMEERMKWDVNQDNKIGLEEVISNLKVISNIINIK